MAKTIAVETNHDGTFFTILFFEEDNGVCNPEFSFGANYDNMKKALMEGVNKFSGEWISATTKITIKEPT